MTPRTYTHAFLLLAAASSVAAQGGRYEPPEETNVFSPPVCQIDENGFFGTIGVVAPVGFNYQIVLDAPDPTATSTIQTRAQSRLLAVSAVEDAISGFVLGTEVFDNLCNRRRLQIKASIRGRRLNAVGVSGNPPDEILPESEYPCDPQPTDGKDCVVVDAALTVFALVEDTTIATDLKGQIAAAMNDGAFDNADVTDTSAGNIDSVSYIELEADAGQPDSTNGSTNQVRGIGSSNNNNNTAVIAGAAVGALVVLGALVFYRRRHSQASKEAEFTPPVGGGSSS